MAASVLAPIGVNLSRVRCIFSFL